MTTMTRKTLKTLSKNLPGFAARSQTDYWVHPETETRMMIRTCTPESIAQAGDMIVRYEDREQVAAKYRWAIRVLAFDEKREQRLMDFERLDELRSELTRQLGRVHLWDYAPEERDSVQHARRYLAHLLEASVPYGEEIVVPGDEMTSFLNNTMKTFEVAEYYYCEEAPEHTLRLSTWPRQPKTVAETIQKLGQKSFEHKKV